MSESEVKRKLRKIYMQHKALRSALTSFTPEELSYALDEGLIGKTKHNVWRYYITNKGLVLMSHEEYNAAEDFTREQIYDKFRECWKTGNFSSFTKVQRTDLKEFGLVSTRSSVMYMPTALGCQILGITEDEARAKYKEHNRNMVIKYPRKRKWRASWGHSEIAALQ